ncbi:hypothetical protein ABC382_00900 [Lysinibacillus sp. 1P01SD]|uniref:hypothetical protein n=1 Tax=Lysinibacillus sp. 1P01SD TaxID=3132285 RepID=UPI0039A07325
MPRVLMYECTKCGWNGDSEAVATIQAHEFMNIDESQISEEDNEFLKVCPNCRPFTLVYSNEF